MFRFAFIALLLSSVVACQSTPEKQSEARKNAVSTDAAQSSTKTIQGTPAKMDEIMASFESQFASMDKDKSGSISRKEADAYLKQEFDRMDVDKNGSLGELPNVNDTDKDGKIEKTEYVKSQSSHLFNDTDSNKDGVLEKDEMRAKVLKAFEGAE